MVKCSPKVKKNKGGGKGVGENGAVEISSKCEVGQGWENRGQDGDIARKVCDGRRERYFRIKRAFCHQALEGGCRGEGEKREIFTHS